MSAGKSSEKLKKFKQACLPFKLINSPGDDANSKCRKRKLSGTENDETRGENPNVELLNGGTKRFIKSDDDNDKTSEELIAHPNNEESAVKPVDSGTTLSENSVEKTDENVNEEGDNSIINEDVIMINGDDDDDDAISMSSNSDVAKNDISIVSTSDNGQSENATPPSKKLNPKVIAKKQESAKKKEERLRLKQEKENARLEKLKEHAEKQRLKQIEKEQKKNAEIEAKRLRELEKEKEKKQKEDERKAKELEKERERKQKEEEKKAKELEKERERKQKEDERKAKELEKEKQREEKLMKEEMEKKKKEKVKAAFVGFFKPKSVNTESSKKDEEIIDVNTKTYFMPFQTKQDMKMAPFCRAYLNSDKKKNMDQCINQCEKNKNLLYLNLLKTGKHKPSKSEATWPVQIEDDADIIIIETGSTNDEDMNTIDSSKKNHSRKYRWKLLQFDENKRPPYWGTWRKKSLYVKPRRPFACDKIMFDYEIDSDDEWEEEDPGEDIHGTDNEEEPEDEYEVDNDVFVPHGYLSDEEGEGQDNDSDSEETQKEKLKLLGEKFEAEIKKKTERIKPRLVGCIWIPNDVTNPANVNKSVADTLLKYRCVWDNEEPIITEAPIVIDSPKEITASENKKTLLLPDSIMSDLITFVHGNSNGIKMIAKNFVDKLGQKDGQNMDNSVSLSSVKRTVKTIAIKSSNMGPWCVNKESFEKYGVEYPKNVENEVSKPNKYSANKITSFLTPHSQKSKTVSLNKSCSETDQSVLESEKDDFVPKNLFKINESPKPSVNSLGKEEQKVNIVGGKKRITPILLSPKKNVKLITKKQPNEKSPSPEMEMFCEGTSVANK